MTRQVFALLLAAGFLFFGLQKFGAQNEIFIMLADNSGIGLFEPVIRLATGAAELVAAVLLIIPRTRIAGGVLGFFILLGAIFFHLTPWLGIAPEGIGIWLFLVATAMFVLSIVVIVGEKKAGRRLLFFRG